MEENKIKRSSYESFIFGIISGLGSRLLVAPIERVVLLK